MDVSENPPADEFSALREEVARLRDLVGPSEKTYEDLKRDAIGTRGAARKAESETGRLRAEIVELRNEVRRWQRDFVWFRNRVIQKIPSLLSRFRRSTRIGGGTSNPYALTVELVRPAEDADVAQIYAALSATVADIVILQEQSGGVNPSAGAFLLGTFLDKNVVVAYSDEVVNDNRGRDIKFSYKPGWSPERLRSHFYIGDLLAVRRLPALNALLAIATDDTDPSPRGIALRWDLIFRLTENSGSVAHIPQALFGRRSTDPLALNRHQSSDLIECARVVQSHCDRVGIDAEVELAPSGNSFHLRRHIPASLLVSLIIPTCGSSGMIWGQERIFIIEFLQSIIKNLTWTHIEIVIVADSILPASTKHVIEQICGDLLVWVDYDLPFNFSDKINCGRDAASGEILILLNDDMEVISPDFIEELIGLALDPGVGAVGAKLLLEDGRIQHIGHRYAEGVFHLFSGYKADFAGPDDMCLVTRECIGVTGACLAIRSETFDAVGGMSVDFPNNFNDVDFALRLRDKGFRNLVTPHAVLYHFESVTRDSEVLKEEIRLLWALWRSELSSDPYSNPNLEPGRIEWIEKGNR